MGFGNKVKDALGIEGNTLQYLRPMLSFNCANITIGGAGYPLNLYHQQFLNFVEGMSTKVTGTISMINGIIDSFTDIAMGIITDRTRSRFGKHRIYLILGIVPFFISYIMKWSSFGIADNYKFAYYLLSAFLYSSGYTMLNIPHDAMLPTVAPKYFERTQFKIVEYAFNSIGQSLSFVFMGLMLGGVNMSDPSPADKGKYMFCGMVLAVWFLWSPILCFFTCKEESSLDLENPPIDWKYLFNEYIQVFRNKAFRQYFFINLLDGFARSFYSYADQFYIISIAERYRIFNVLNVVSGVSEFCGSPVNYFLVRYKDKRICGLLLGPLMAAGLMINGFVTPSTPTIIIYLASVLYNFGFSGPGFVINNIQPDVTDVDELITGRRREGVIMTFNSFVKKTVNSFLTGILGFTLSAFGYDTKKKSYSEQTKKTIFGIRLMSSYLPVVFTVICIVLIYFYKMNKTDHEEIKRVIKEKHETGECTISPAQKKRIEEIAGHRWEDMWIGQGCANREIENVIM